jgi:hypothetical protein
MAVIISIGNGRADRRFDNPKNRQKYVKTFNFEAGLPIELDNDNEIEWAKNMAATYPTQYFLSEEEYADYISAIAETEDPEEENTPEAENDLPDFDELAGRPVEELRKLSLELGIGSSPLTNRKVLAKRILAQLEENKKLTDVIAP